MNKKILVFLLAFLFFIPNTSLALSEEYEDKVYRIVGEEIVEGKVNIYLFYGAECPHCAKEEKFLDQLQKKYPDQLQIFRYESWKNEKNKKLMYSVKTLFNLPTNDSVPFTVIGKETQIGYNDYVGEKIESMVRNYLELDQQEESIIQANKEKIPILGEIDVKEVSVGLVAVVLGFVDGFNPCAMWILLFLINMLFDMKNKKRMFLLGFLFLFTSGAIYFLSMLGITTVLSFISVPLLRSFIGVVALIVGLFNIRKYIIKRKEETGCQIVDDKKRKKIFQQIRKFTKEKNIWLAMLGVMILAVSVNTIELACSTVFPATFAEILAINEITGVPRLIYLLIYTVFYMLDDLIVFIIAVSTLSITTASSKYGKYSSLIGGIIMILMGLLLIWKPEWIMLNF